MMKQTDMTSGTERMAGNAVFVPDDLCLDVAIDTERLRCVNLIAQLRLSDKAGHINTRQ